MNHRHAGLIYAISAYIFWGIVPIFWKQIHYIDALEVVAHRMVWSCLMVITCIIIMRQWRSFKAILSQPKTILRSALGACLISSNWIIFIWAVSNNHLVEISMGYFINPLISVLLGVILFGDRLRRGQLIPISMMVIAVLYLLITLGEFPWIAFSLAFTFGFYSAVKKTVQLPSTHGMAIETGIFFIPALVYLLFLNQQGSGEFGSNDFSTIMLILAGLCTIIPLTIFAAAAKISSMTVLGMTQYIGPSLQLLIGVFLYNEEFGQAQLISFGLIWFGLIIFTADQLSHQRKVINPI